MLKEFLKEKVQELQFDLCMSNMSLLWFAVIEWAQQWWYNEKSFERNRKKGGHGSDWFSSQFRVRYR